MNKRVEELQTCLDLLKEAGIEIRAGRDISVLLLIDMSHRYATGVTQGGNIAELGAEMFSLLYPDESRLTVRATKSVIVDFDRLDLACLELCFAR